MVNSTAGETLSAIFTVQIVSIVLRNIKLFFIYS